MGNTFPKEQCLPNCLQRLDLTCDDRGLKRPEGEKKAKARIQCDEKCAELNAITSIVHVSDEFVSMIADGSCGGPRGSGKGKSGHYSVEIRGTDTGTMDSGNGSGTKAQKLDQRIKIADEMSRTMEMRRDSRIWYQSFSDWLGGPDEPSLKKIAEFKFYLDAAKAQRAAGDLEGARRSVDQALEKGRGADEEYDTYQRKSLDHAEKVAVAQGVVGAVLFVVGSAGTALAYGLGGTAAAGSLAGGGEVISLTARLAARQVVQETLKKAALILFGVGVAQEGEK